MQFSGDWGGGHQADCATVTVGLDSRRVCAEGISTIPNPDSPLNGAAFVLSELCWVCGKQI